MWEQLLSERKQNNKIETLQLNHYLLESCLMTAYEKLMKYH